ncbi:putative phosphoglycerate mutase [Sphaerotilus hippei]|uniref:Putative phosphoglycerate mutase n=1 Tax=Sphaerotilus hippei TaxID=744406 RepID=A0A318GZJ0_9BURK|nr:histidine phosphatase family protein [Sphaerotilus hippei]PXW95755.1 putative phosphoglycerate mutase [Sphaerotilus hippei]
MTDFTLVRHGETDWNRVHRFQGQLDVPLNELGQLQAQRLADRLAGERFDAVVVSDLSRTRATAQPLLDRLGLPARYCAQWREQCFGQFEGHEAPVIIREHPELWAAWARHEADFALPGGGESNLDFHARVFGALRSLALEHAGRHVLVVTHGGVLDMFWRTAHGLPLGGARRCSIPNAGVNRLRWQDERLHVVDWGDEAHLADLPRQPSTTPLSELHPPA